MSQENPPDSITSHQRTQLSYYESPSDYEKGGLFRRELGRTYKRKADIIRSSILPLTHKSKILEIGAGSGLATYFLVKSFEGEYTALDISPEMLKIAEERIRASNIRYVCRDAENPGLPDEHFDAVIGVDVIHHLEDPVGAFSIWKRLVRPGGKMCFLETNIYNPLNLANIGDEHEVRSFLNTDTNLAKWSKAAGWESVCVTPAPAFTPSKPEILAPVYDIIDKLLVNIPVLNKLTALWLIENTRD